MTKEGRLRATKQSRNSTHNKRFTQLTALLLLLLVIFLDSSWYLFPRASCQIFGNVPPGGGNRPRGGEGIFGRGRGIVIIDDHEEDDDLQGHGGGGQGILGRPPPGTARNRRPPIFGGKRQFFCFFFAYFFRNIFGFRFFFGFSFFGFLTCLNAY